MSDNYELSAETRDVDDVLLLRDHPAMGWGIPFSSDDDEAYSGPTFYALALQAVNMEKFMKQGDWEKAMALPSTRYVFLMEREEIEALHGVVNKVWKDIQDAEN
jgi:hypothetical protein